MEKGSIDRVRICAENAIQKCIKQMNYLRLASRLDIVVAHLNTQANMSMINKSMGKLGSVRERRGERLGEVGFSQVWQGCVWLGVGEGERGWCVCVGEIENFTNC